MGSRMEGGGRGAGERGAHNSPAVSGESISDVSSAAAVPAPDVGHEHDAAGGCGGAGDVQVGGTMSDFRADVVAVGGEESG